MTFQSFGFDLIATDSQSQARAGIVHTPHGDIETPVFMPVGTQATVKSLSPHELKEVFARLILANTYHLHLRPTDALIREAGGLHVFESWDKTILTDSGGFQVFSLRDISTITDQGVWFKSHIDGSRHFFSPASVMEIQHNLGADIIMAFDECPAATASKEEIARAVERTKLWAMQCREHHELLPSHFGYRQALFGIIQGGIHKDLRERCVAALLPMDFPGYAVGGCAVGEKIKEMYDTVAFTTTLLPAEKPRYLMGVGKPHNILECISRGIDMFDCVLPTRNGRNGSVFTSLGKLNIKNAQYTRDFNNPLDPACDCYACTNFSRAYLRHLFMAREILAIRMFTLHNICYFIRLAKQARHHILANTFVQWKQETLMKLGADSSEECTH